MSADSTEAQAAFINEMGEYVMHYGRFQGFPLWYIIGEPGGLLWLDRHCDELLAEGRETPTLRALLKYLDLPAVRTLLTAAYADSIQEELR